MTPDSTRVIAIVDDDESVRRAMGRLLRSLSCPSELFASGDEFLRVLDSTSGFSPRCVVLDVQMPGLNGLDVQQRLRQDRRDLPIIFVSAYDAPEVRDRALADGAVAYLRKPFDRDELVRVLGSVISLDEPDPPGRHASGWPDDDAPAPDAARRGVLSPPAPTPGRSS